MNRYEHDKLKPGLKMLTQLAAAFGVSVDELVDSKIQPEELTIQDSDLFHCFRQAQSMSEEDKMVIKKLVQAMVIKNQVQSIGRLAV